jgi:hypothetical protein
MLLRKKASRSLGSESEQDVLSRHTTWRLSGVLALTRTSRIPLPHHPLGAKGVGESATVGAPAAIVNAVVDALWHLGVRHMDIPITPAKVWKILRDKGVTE